MKILIVEDEALALSRLKRLLGELGEADVECVADAVGAEKIIANTFFELIFLDINLPNASGIDLAYLALQKNPNVFIVFQTAHEKYALKAFEVGAVDYLLKPYSKEQLQKTIERVKNSASYKAPTFMIREDSEYELIGANDIYIM